MTDIKSSDARSRNMSAIKGKNTKPEETVRKYLFSQGFRYRKNVPALPGCPDVVLPKYSTVIFVNGCFWHKHDCGRFKWPTSNEEYWTAKIIRNVERDTENQKKLQDMGWRVIIIWECELKKQLFPERMERLKKEILEGRN